MPPTHPFAPPASPSRSAWPTVLGIIAIVFGALSVLGGCWGVVSPFVFKKLIDAIPETAAGDLGEATIPFEITADWQGWIIAGSLLTTGLAVLLLIAGIGLLKRRRWGVDAAWWWVVLKMIFVVVNAAVAYQMQQDIYAALGEQQANMPGLSAGFYQLGAIAGVTFAVVWGWALPVFVMIWFSRRVIREEVNEWG